MTEILPDPQMEYIFDEDTQFVEGMPLISMGETYNGKLKITNLTDRQYIILSLTPEDKDMEIQKAPRYLMPKETIELPFKISTEVTRRTGFILKTNIHGGYIL